MFNAMMDGIREESVGNLFNLQFEIQENPIVEEVGSGAQLAFGGALPGVTAGGVPQQAAAPAPAPAAPAPARHARPLPPPPEPVAPPAAFGKRPGGGQAGGQQAGNRSRGRHAADGRGHATAAGRGQAATRSGGSPVAEPATAEVTDTVPEATGPQPVLPAGFEPHRPRHLQYSAPSEDGGIEMHGDEALDPYANVGRNDLCPCGSGRKYKRCHGGRN
jgi:preprotein translocase subunit SecA